MPRPIFIHSILLIASFAMVLGCSDDTKYQAEMRGSWALQTRKMPPDRVIEAPAISGQFEWYPTAKNQAHVSISISEAKDAISLLDGIYTIEKDAFTLRSNLRVGGPLGGPTEMSFQINPETSSGKITSDDARLTMVQEDGTRFEFIGAQLTISYPNGVEDVWKRLKDQKGDLAK